MVRKPCVVDGDLKIVFDDSGVIVIVSDYEASDTGFPDGKSGMWCMDQLVLLENVDPDGTITFIRHNVNMGFVFDWDYIDNIYIRELTFDMKGNGWALVIENITSKEDRLYDRGNPNA